MRKYVDKYIYRILNPKMKPKAQFGSMESQKK